jgi:H3 lysine-79-specific histone-lysine N-methyltransferase
MRFLDLGSGVGNAAMQASLQTGCKSFGIELLPSTAQVAQLHLEHFLQRCRMWGLQPGEVDLRAGDMLANHEVDEVICVADVVLVNNEVFDDPRQSCNLPLKIMIS